MERINTLGSGLLGQDGVISILGCLLSVGVVRGSELDGRDQVLVKESL